MLDLATTLGSRYRIEARLGGGGMADVFEAYDEALSRPVAIKLLRGIDDPGAARRFAEEIRLTARLSHPNVVRLFDAGEHDGSPYLVLERVDGGTLAHLMNDGPLQPGRVATIGAQLASALAYAHEQGVVHRDVKPSNVLLTADQTVRLADFGIALTATATRLTVAGQVAGSAGYVSPEQVLGTGAGAPSDVYALGLVLLECLTGEPPWSGTTVEVALARIASDPPIPQTLGADWHRLLVGMTARQPEDRPPMAAVAFGLQQIATGQPLADDVAPLIVARRSHRRASLLAGVGAVALLVVATSALLSPPRTAVAASPVTGNLIVDSVLGGAAVPAAPVAAAADADVADDTPAKREKSPRKNRTAKAHDGARARAAATVGDTASADAADTDAAEATNAAPAAAPAAAPTAPRAPERDAAPAPRQDLAPAPRRENDPPAADNTTDTPDSTNPDSTNTDSDTTDSDTGEDGGDTETDTTGPVKDKDKAKSRVNVPTRTRTSADVPGLARGLR